MMSDTTVLKSLIQESKDGEWGKGEPFADSVEMAVIRGTDFDGVRVGDTDGLPIRHIPAHIADRKTLQPNDILIETAGGSGNRPTGRTLFVTQSLIQKSELPLTCASFSRFIRIDPAKADPNYVFWMLQHQFASGVMWKYSTRHTGVARFQYTVFSETERFDLPPLPTQRRIASILSAYDDLIENNTRRIKILEQMAQAIYREWFVEFRAPGVKLRKATPEEQKVTGKDRFPVGWELKQLGDVIELAYGKGLKADTRIPGQVPVYGSAGVVGHHNESLVSGPGIIVGRKGNVGSVFWSDEDFFPIDTVFYVVTELNLHYVYYNLQKQNFINNDAAVPGLSRNQAYLNPFVVPASGTLNAFGEFIGPLFGQIQNLTKKNANLRQTRDLLLPRLVGGEIAVEGLNIITD